MSDVKDILGVSQTGVSTGSTVDSILKKKEKQKTPKLEGSSGRGVSTFEKLQQSFLNLEGETLTFSAPVTTVGLKEKRKVKVSWEKRGFRNGSRNDNMILYHYSKSNEKIDDYKFSRYNKKMDVLVYNEEEYDLYLRDSDWSREDTDQLLDLAKRFDTRFIMVHDRFQGSVPRSVEELKERYYKIQSKLVELRTKPEEDPYHNPLTNYNFNKVYESERKLQVDKIFHLTKEQVEEEETLSEKYQNIEKHLLKHSKECKSILKMANLAITNGPLKHYSQQDVLPENSKKKNKRKFDSIDDTKSIAPQNNRQIQRVDATLYELHIGKPYNNAVAKKLYNDLKQDIITLVDVQKYYLEKRYHCEILKSQKEFLEKEIEAMQITPEILAIPIEEENEQPVATSQQSNINNNNNQINLDSSSSSVMNVSSSSIQTPSNVNTPNPPTFQMYASVDLSQSVDNLASSSSSMKIPTIEDTTPVKQKSAKKKKDDVNDLASSSGSIQTETSSTKKKKTGTAEKKSSSKKKATANNTDLANAPIPLDLSMHTDQITVNVESIEPPLKKTKSISSPKEKKEKKKTPKSTEKKKKASNAE